RKLVHHDTGQGIGNLKTAFMNANQIENALVRGQIALARDFAADFRVFRIVEVLADRVKNRVTPQAIRLMHLKIETNGCHASLVRVAHILCAPCPARYQKFSKNSATPVSAPFPPARAHTHRRTRAPIPSMSAGELQTFRTREALPEGADAAGWQ